MNKIMKCSLSSLVITIVFLANSLSLQADTCDNCLKEYENCINQCACQQGCGKCRTTCLSSCLKTCKEDPFCRLNCLPSCSLKCKEQCHCPLECQEKCDKEYSVCSEKHCREWVLVNKSQYEMNVFRNDGSKIGTSYGPNPLVLAETDFPITAAYAPDCPTLNAAPKCKYDPHYSALISDPGCYDLFYRVAFEPHKRLCFPKVPQG